jgi:hypothetical protein
MEMTPVAEAAGESAEKGPKAGGFLRLFSRGGWKRQHMGRWQTRFRLHEWRGRRNQSLALGRQLAAYGSLFG